MAVKLISKRAIFPMGEQKKFINSMIAKISIQKMAKICKISERTMRDWHREKFSVDLIALRKLCKHTNTQLPRNIEIKNRFWYAINNASAGGLAVFKKYGKIGGDPEHRKKKWHEWWEKKGKYKKHPVIGMTKSIKKPFFSKKLAEFVGIMLGDGSITKYQIVVTFCLRDEEKYSKFVANLIQKLFNAPIGIYYDKNAAAVDIIVSRIKLAKYCIDKIGLKSGNKIKNQVDIPDWIKKNEAYSIACVRGLVDTDGCVFTHKYKSNGKYYSYKKILFTSLSRPLRQSVFNILKNSGFNPRLAKQGDVCLDSSKDVQKYFQLFGFHNQKHLDRFFH
ncbi:MAG: hypothetical protein HYT19_00045 [Candidatus Nealsonbacteria bacterium]|nr:hypothetical protein [Candidatus Nealsonbacteria bacterium]